MPVFEQGTKEWLEARKGKISASLGGAFEGMNPYSTAEDVLRTMVRDLAGVDSEFKGGPAVDHGNRMEPHARKWLEKHQGYTVDETGFVVHPDYPFLGASPDGLVGIDGGIEIKCPFPKFTKAPYSVLDKGKEHYLWQCNLVMEVCDLEWIDFLCFLVSKPTDEPQFHIDRVTRNHDWLNEDVPSHLAPRKQ